MQGTELPVQETRIGLSMSNKPESTNGTVSGAGASLDGDYFSDRPEFLPRHSPVGEDPDDIPCTIALR